MIAIKNFFNNRITCIPRLLVCWVIGHINIIARFFKLNLTSLVDCVGLIFYQTLLCQVSHHHSTTIEFNLLCQLFFTNLPDTHLFAILFKHNLTCWVNFVLLIFTKLAWLYMYFPLNCESLLPVVQMP